MRALLTGRLRDVRDYYDHTTTMYLRHFGATLQAGMTAASVREDCTERNRAHNLWIAQRAGLRGGERVLDAGCGVAGPAIDIARNIPGLTVIGITISPIQALVARKLIQAAQLQSRVQAIVADFHHLPLPDAAVDATLFLESVGHAFDQATVFAEARRTLVPGGRLYLKDVFLRKGALSESQRMSIETFNQTFAYDVRRIQDTIDAIARAGFVDIDVADLSPWITTEPFMRAMRSQNGLRTSLNALGRNHFAAFTAMPLFFGEIVARVPTTHRVST
jgi:cyclopropane fatty-acyl-phospholipid synthase-like methyltransferase